MKTTARRWSAIGMILATMILGAATRAAAQQSTTPATTQITPGEWSVTPFIGFGFSGDLDSATGAVGVAGGYGWSPAISLEGEFNLLPAAENNGLVEVNSKSWSLAANLLYHFAPRPYRPYGVIGIGAGHSAVDVDSTVLLPANFDLTSTVFVVNFGGGVEKPIRDNIHFRGDLRYFFGGDLVPDYWRFSVGLRFVIGNR